MVATDRISCFDVILNNQVTKKGTVLTQMSKFWFDMTEDILPNHMISVDVKDMPEFFQQPQFDGNSMLCRKLNMLPIECIVRGYITVSILSGGNMDVITFSSVVQHGLIARSRIFTVSVLLPDKPGELQRVAGVIAGENGNIIKLEHNQFVTINRNSAVELVITIEAFGPEHKEQILRVLSEQGYRPIEKKPKAIF